MDFELFQKQTTSECQLHSRARNIYRLAHNTSEIEF